VLQQANDASRVERPVVRVTYKHFTKESASLVIVKIGRGRRIEQRHHAHDAGDVACLPNKFFYSLYTLGRCQLGFGVNSQHDIVPAKGLLQLAIRSENRIVCGEHMLDRTVELKLSPNQRAADG
jgi:hypothetical protein